MKYLTKLPIAAVAAVALTAFTAGSASATTLEVNGVVQNTSVAFSASVEPGTSILLRYTAGSLASTCKKWQIGGTTSVFTGPKVIGPLSTFTFEECSKPVVVHKKGQLYVEHDSGSTHGTVFSENAEWTLTTSFPGQPW